MGIGIGIGEGIGLGTISNGDAFASTFSMVFDGSNERFSCGNVTQLNGSGVATWMGWVNPAIGATGDAGFSQYGAGTDRQFAWFQTTTRTRIDVCINEAVAFRASGGGDLLDADAWNFVAMTFNRANVAADRLRVYVGRGGSIARVTETGGLTAPDANLVASTSDFLIGAQADPAPIRFWEGHIDEVSIYNEEKSLAQLTTLYNSGNPTDLEGESGLQGWWRMGEDAVFGANWTVPDDSPNSNDAVSVNMEEADRVTVVP